MEIILIWFMTIMGINQELADRTGQIESLQAHQSEREGQIESLQEQLLELQVFSAATAARPNTIDKAHEGSINKIIDVIQTEVFDQPAD